MAKPEKPNKHGGCDDNTERPLIDLIKTLLTVEFKKVSDALENFGLRLQQQEQQNIERHRILMTGLETLTASVTALHAGDAALTTAVNDAIAHISQPGATDAQLTTLAGLVDTKTASDAALVVALNNALNPPPPVPEPVP